MKYQIKQDNIVIQNLQRDKYNELVQMLYGLNTKLHFKDNNKYNLKKDNVIVIH